METSITVTRERLYEEVWTTPVSTLAKKYGLSDRGLGKMCERHHVPRPGRGYWAKRHAGQNPGKVPLPPLPKVEVKPIAVRPPQPRRPRPTADSAPVEPAPAFDKEIRKLLEHEAANPIVVPSRLRSPHPLVALAVEEQKQLAAAAHRRRYEPDWLRRQRETAPNILDDARLANPTIRDRAFRVMNALLKQLEDRGHRVSCRHEHGDRDVEIGLLGNRFELVASQSELNARGEPRRRRRDVPVEEVESERGLSLRITRRGDYKPFLWVGDRRGRPVEARLNEAVVGMLRSVDAERQKQAEQQRYAAHHREELERKRAAQAAEAGAAETARQERARVDNLLRQVTSWRQSQDIRALIAAVQGFHDAAQRPIEPGSDLANWMAWAVDVADRMDPLATKPSLRSEGEWEHPAATPGPV